MGRRIQISLIPCELFGTSMENAVYRLDTVIALCIIISLACKDIISAKDYTQWMSVASTTYLFSMTYWLNWVYIRRAPPGFSRILSSFSSIGKDLGAVHVIVLRQSTFLVRAHFCTTSFMDLPVSPSCLRYPAFCIRQPVSLFVLQAFFRATYTYLL